MQVRAAFLRARLVLGGERHLLLTDGGGARAPFAVHAVENQDLLLRLQTEHVGQIMRLVGREDDLGARAQRRLDEEPRKFRRHEQHPAKRAEASDTTHATSGIPRQSG
jgi:hypothetical protein